MTYSAGAVLAAGSGGLALLLDEVVGDSDNVNLELGALLEGAEVVEELRAVANGIAVSLVVDLVTAVDALAIGTRVGSLLNSHGVERRSGNSRSDGRRSGNRGGEESDGGEELHLEGWLGWFGKKGSFLVKVLEGC